jgi:predicted DNA-binding transcriptional regulator YafY
LQVNKKTGAQMDIRAIIASAGRKQKTIIITAREEDGSVETREAEPYSYRFKGGNELFFCYDILKQGTRSFIVSRIISVQETSNTFTPRWKVEV